MCCGELRNASENRTRSSIDLMRRNNDRGRRRAMSAKAAPLWVILLAGGDRRQHSRPKNDAVGLCLPKQYCSLDGGPSLRQLALQRALRLVRCERLVVVVTEPHRRWRPLELSSLPRSNVVVQPRNLGTGLNQYPDGLNRDSANRFTPTTYSLLRSIPYRYGQRSTRALNALSAPFLYHARAD